MPKIKIGVIIATSHNRNSLLFNRSLKSVLEQTRIPDEIFIVDDNDNDNVSTDIQHQLKMFARNNIEYIKNYRTKNMSGTGAWNSAILRYKNKFSKNDYIAILDDDDSWHPTYLEKCELCIYSRDFPDEIVAFVKRSDCEQPLTFEVCDISIDNFLIGNPGIQGSNMFFRLEIFNKILFDECLASCTDRDFMIRYLQSFSQRKIAIVNEVLVNYFASDDSVTYNPQLKQRGLDYFYKKHILLFDKMTLDESLNRSKKLFAYRNAKQIKKLWNCINKYAEEEKIGVGIAFHNDGQTVKNAVTSVLSQKYLHSKIWIVICDDSSEQDLEEILGDIVLNPRIIIWKVYFNNVSKTRNFINHFMNDYFYNIKLFCRLDSDDVYADNDMLSKIEQVKNTENADVIIASNYQLKNGEVIGQNVAVKQLRNESYLLDRLKRMADGDFKAELPSCNTILTKNSLIDYPNVLSGEDHFLMVRLLLNKNLKIEFLSELFLINYNISGNRTAENRSNNKYIESRRQLYQEAKILCKKNSENPKQ